MYVSNTGNFNNPLGLCNVKNHWLQGAIEILHNITVCGQTTKMKSGQQLGTDYRTVKCVDLINEISQIQSQQDSYLILQIDVQIDYFLFVDPMDIKNYL